MCQSKYAKKLLSSFSLLSSKPALTPMTSGNVLSKGDGIFIDDSSTYRSMIGALQYYVVTRLDISFAVSKLCQFLSI